MGAILDGVDVLAISTMPCAVPTIAAAREQNPAAKAEMVKLQALVDAKRPK